MWLKIFDSKRNYLHYLFYFKIFAFNISAYYVDSLNLNEEICKIFPQTNFEINFYGQIISIKSNGSIQLMNNLSKNSKEFLHNNENTNYYKVIINKTKYLFVIEKDKNIEIDEILKLVEKFDIIEALKSQVLYIKDNKNKYNFLSHNINNNLKYSINKGSKVLINIKSKYSINDLEPQIKSYDKILYNIYQSCNENINNYYLFIITDEYKSKRKTE